MTDAEKNLLDGLSAVAVNVAGILWPQEQTNFGTINPMRAGNSVFNGIFRGPTSFSKRLRRIFSICFRLIRQQGIPSAMGVEAS